MPETRQEVLRLGALLRAERVTVTARGLDDGGVECGVRDTGEGIEESRLSKVFEKGETDGRAGGTGLGLAIVRQVVEAHGGKVRAERRTGEGSTFVFDIPVESPADDAASVTD